MKSVPMHNVLVLCVLALCLFFSCGKRDGRIIPRSKMAKIYAEMFVTDQWIAATPSVKRIADTSLVYEPILEKYGYDSEDYRRSVDYYLDDPERFSRIFRTASEIIDSRLQELKDIKKKTEAVRTVPDFVIDVSRLVPDIGRIPPRFTPDSIVYVLDTVQMYFVPCYVERGDTVYRGPEVIVRVDTVSLSDSIVRNEVHLPEPCPESVRLPDDEFSDRSIGTAGMIRPDFSTADKIRLNISDSEQ